MVTRSTVCARLSHKYMSKMTCSQPLRIGRHKANISRSEPNVWLKLIRFFLPFRLRIQPHRLGFLWKPHYPSGKSHGASTACYMRRPASGPLADQYPATCLQVPVWGPTVWGKPPAAGGRQWLPPALDAAALNHVQSTRVRQSTRLPSLLSGWLD